MLDDPVSKDLLDKRFIVPVDYNEIEQAVKIRSLRRQRAKENRKNRIGYMRISLTESCNLQCKYCFVNDIFEHKGHMDKETFINSMNWFIQENQGYTPIVQYFGGEPLLRMDFIELGHAMLQEALNNGILTGFSEEIVTNGTLVTSHIAQNLYQKNINLIFSLDGWEEINDKNRVYPNGKGSFQSIIKGMQNYKEVGGTLGAIITPTQENIAIFPEIIRYLVEELKCEEISINTPQPNEKGWDIDGRQLANAIIASWGYCESKKIPLNQPGNNIVFLVNNKLPQTNSCMNLTYGSSENMFGVYVTSDQKISSCVVECDKRCTKSFNEFKIDEEYVNWHFEDHSTNACLKCIGYNICGGPCSIEALLKEDKKLNTEKCKFYKTLIPWALAQ